MTHTPEEAFGTTQGACPYMQLAEAATYSRLSTRTLRRAIADGSLLAYKPGGRLLIRRNDLEAWITASSACRATPSETLQPRRPVQGDGKLGGLAALDAAIEAAGGMS